MYPDYPKQQISVLIHLLDDPDQEVYEEVSREIKNTGFQAVSYLEEAWLNSTDLLCRSRIENLIHDIQFDTLFNDFSAWISAGCIDLLEGYLIASRLKYPNLNENSILLELNRLTRNVWIELNDNLTPIEKIKVFNHVFFEMYGVGGEVLDIHQPEAYFLNNIVQTWRGNAVSVAMLYVIVAEKLQLPVKCVNLPGNFIACYTHENDEFLSGYLPLSQAKFYINPLAAGAIFTRKEINLYLEKALILPNDACFEPANNKLVMIRWLMDLIEACNEKGELSYIDDARKLAKLLDSNK